MIVKLAFISAYIQQIELLCIRITSVLVGFKIIFLFHIIIDMHLLLTKFRGLNYGQMYSFTEYDFFL